MINIAFQERYFYKWTLYAFYFYNIQRFKITENRDTKNLYTGTHYLMQSVGQ